MQRAAGADAIGPILQGFSKPWLDLSRGASVDDILECCNDCVQPVKTRRARVAPLAVFMSMK